MTLDPTPGQTVGPFFHYALPYDGGAQLVPPGHPQAISLTGVVLDGAGAPVPDALVEIWQADADGRVPREAGSLHRDGVTFTGFGRCATDRTGRYRFTTVLPGLAERPGQGTDRPDGHAPYIAVAVFARGLLHRLRTRCYPPGPLVADDPFLRGVPEARRATLVADRDAHGLVFDIRLQGDHETVFLDDPLPHPRD